MSRLVPAKEMLDKALKGKYADKRKLSEDAIYLERVLCGEAGGWQDQIAAAYGGFNRIDFNAEGFDVRPVIISPERKRLLNENLMMFFTGFTRYSADVQSANNINNPGKDKLSNLGEMRRLVDEAERILINRDADLNEFGKLLDYTWRLKRGIGSKVSSDSIDELYAAGLKAGATGGKLLGAGGGGFLLFYVQPQFRGGTKALMKYLSRTIKYPKAAIRAGAQGRVILQFIINEDGTVSGTKVVRSVHPALDAEAMRVVSSMPRWAPGKIGGKAVRVKYTIPVKFQMPTGTIVDPKAYRQWKKYMKAQSDSTAALRHYKGKNDKKAGK